MVATPANLDLAMADYQRVIDQQDDSQEDHTYSDYAKFMMGYCHYLRGDKQLAQQFYDQERDGISYEEMGFTGDEEPVDTPFGAATAG